MRLYPRGLDMRACHPAPKLVTEFSDKGFLRPTLRLSRKAGLFWRD